MSKHMLRVQNLKKHYHDGERTLEVLRGLDCSFEPGEIVAIVGPSGSGKSTFLNLVGALDRPTEGAIWFQDENLSRLSASRLDQIRARKMGFVFQFHHLLPELRAWENVAVPAMITRAPSGECRERAIALLEKVGLKNRMDHIPSKLSGGEQQRVALARALMNDPDLVLADEPTGNLDAAMGEQVIQLLWETAREPGKTLIIVTHERDIAEQADRILRLDEGLFSRLES